MKIFHIISGLKTGGAESALYNFLAHFPNQQVHEHIVVYFHHGHTARTIQQLGIKVFQIKGIFSCYDPVAYVRLSRIIRASRPDLIHSSLWSANIIGRLIARQFNIPIICDIHGNPSFDGKFRNWIEIKTAHFSSKIVAVSDGIKESYSKTIIGAVAPQKQQDIREKLIVIKNGVNTSLLHQKASRKVLKRSDINCSQTDFVIGSVGRLEPIKSYHVLIQATAILIQKYPMGIRLCLVGDGSERKNLEKLAQDLNISTYVTFTGMRSDPYFFYPLFNCFALSSQSEGLSIAVLEALAFGLPIVTTHDSNSHEAIVDGANGYIVQPNQPEALACAIEKLFCDPTKIKSMRFDNIKKANKDFSLQSVINKYRDLYQNVVLEKNLH